MADEGLCGRGCLALLSSKVQTPISPSPLHDDCAHVVVVAAGEKMLLVVGLGPEYSQFLLRFLVLKVDNFLRSLSVILQHSELYSGVGSTQLWYMIYHPTCTIILLHISISGLLMLCVSLRLSIICSNLVRSPGEIYYICVVSK